MSVWPIILPGTSDGKKLTYNQPRLAQALRGSRPCEVTLILERLNATRSPRANRAHWAVTMQALSDHTGYTPEECHEIVKAKFLAKKYLLPDARTGEVVEELVIGTSSTRLDSVQWSEFQRNIRLWALEDLGVVIPEPDPRLRTREF